MEISGKKKMSSAARFGILILAVGLICMAFAGAGAASDSWAAWASSNSDCVTVDTVDTAYTIGAKSTSTNANVIAALNDLSATSKTVSTAGISFTLACDVDFNGESFTPIGSNDPNDSSHWFAGTFNGGNHTISNMIISSSSSGYLAFFAFVTGNANISNLKFKNCEVTCTSTEATTKYFAFGMLIGRIEGGIDVGVSNIETDGCKIKVLSGGA